MKCTIDFGRIEIITLLNRRSDEFERLKNEVFYYNKRLKCWLSRKKECNSADKCVEVAKNVGDKNG